MLHIFINNLSSSRTHDLVVYAVPTGRETHQNSAEKYGYVTKFNKLRQPQKKRPIASRTHKYTKNTLVYLRVVSGTYFTL